MLHGVIFGPVVKVILVTSFASVVKRFVVGLALVVETEGAVYVVVFDVIDVAVVWLVVFIVVDVGAVLTVVKGNPEVASLGCCLIIWMG